MQNTFSQLAFGAVAGLAGTMTIQTLLKAHQKLAPESLPPMNEDPGHFMIRKAEQLLPQKARERIHEKAESASAKLLGLGYGMTFGALYAALRPKTRRPLLEGALLGIATWAAGYLGWLPGAKLMPPVWKQNATQVALPLAEHALYGVATVESYRWLRARARQASFS